jgi:hypothetical protein
VRGSESDEFEGEIGDICESILGTSLKAPMNGLFERDGQVWIDVAEQSGRAVENSAADFFGGWSGEGQRSGDELMQNHAERPDIRSSGNVSGGEHLLRGHVEGRAHDRLGLCER